MNTSFQQYGENGVWNRFWWNTHAPNCRINAQRQHAIFPIQRTGKSQPPPTKMLNSGRLPRFNPSAVPIPEDAQGLQRNRRVFPDVSSTNTMFLP